MQKVNNILTWFTAQKEKPNGCCDNQDYHVTENIVTSERSALTIVVISLFLKTSVIFQSRIFSFVLNQIIMEIITVLDNGGFALLSSPLNLPLMTYRWLTNRHHRISRDPVNREHVWVVSFRSGVDNPQQHTLHMWYWMAFNWKNQNQRDCGKGEIPKKLYTAQKSQ